MRKIERPIVTLAAAAVLALLSTGCSSTRSAGVAIAAQPTPEPVRVATQPMVVDRFGEQHDPLATLDPEPRADMQVVQSVDPATAATVELPDPESPKEPWWKRIELHGSISFGVSKSL
jgi:hypothetical protein